MLTYQGILKVKNPVRQVSEKFRTREFVLTDEASTYPQTVLFQLTQDRCELIEGAKIGDELIVHFLLKGREWKNPQGEVKFFNSLDVFRIEKVTKSPVSEPSSGGKKPSSKKEKDATFNNETLVPTPDDDLPF